VPLGYRAGGLNGRLRKAQPGERGQGQAGSADRPGGGLARGRCQLVVKASFKEGVTPGDVTLRPSTIPKEWRIEAPPIPAGQNQSTITITVFGNKFVFPGQTGGLIITATMKSGNQTISGFVPVIPCVVQ